MCLSFSDHKSLNYTSEYLEILCKFIDSYRDISSVWTFTYLTPLTLQKKKNPLGSLTGSGWIQLI